MPNLEGALGVVTTAAGVASGASTVIGVASSVAGVVNQVAGLFGGDGSEYSEAEKKQLTDLLVMEGRKGNRVPWMINSDGTCSAPYEIMQDLINQGKWKKKGNGIPGSSIREAVTIGLNEGFAKRFNPPEPVPPKDWENVSEEELRNAVDHLNLLFKYFPYRQNIDPRFEEALKKRGYDYEIVMNSEGIKELKIKKKGIGGVFELFSNSNEAGFGGMLKIGLVGIAAFFLIKKFRLI